MARIEWEDEAPGIAGEKPESNAWNDSWRVEDGKIVAPADVIQSRKNALYEIAVIRANNGERPLGKSVRAAILDASVDGRANGKHVLKTAISTRNGLDVIETNHIRQQVQHRGGIYFRPER